MVICCALSDTNSSADAEVWRFMNQKHVSNCLMGWGLLCLATVFSTASFAGVQSSVSDGMSSDWEVLFDGTSTSSWREVGMPEFPSDVWVVEDGCLRLLPNSADGKDLISRKRYGEFDLRFEWKLSEGGNSGVKYIVREDQIDPKRARLRRWLLAVAACSLLACLIIGRFYLRDRRSRLFAGLGGAVAGLGILSIYAACQLSQPTGNAVGLEFQLYDDPETGQLTRNLSSGALYDLIAPEKNRTRPSAEFNSGRVVVRGSRVQHWINGARILEYELGSAFLNERIADSKFHSTPNFGEKGVGHISLQNHRDSIWFRSIVIRPF